MQAGQWIGRYLLLDPLGYGAQAVVWRAVQEDPVVREVALKLLNCTQRHSHRQVARLRREAERGMRLMDTALLPAYEFGTVNGFAYMAMPLIRGCTLRDVILARRCRQSDRGFEHPLARCSHPEYGHAVLRSLIGVARSLQVAHDAHIAHRDVKPSNILLDGSALGKAYLIDFGMARDLDVATLAQLRDGSGTPIYMAPEKLQGRQFDEARCDIYAFGVTLFEALTLTLPFEVPEGLSGVALMAYLAVHHPVPRRPDRPALVPPLQAIIDRAMHPDPMQRHETAAHVARDLEMVLAARSGILSATGRPASLMASGDAA